MPSLSNDNNIDIKVSTTGDSSGIDSVSNDMGGMVDKFQDGMKKVAVASGVVGAGITAFAKSSTDYLQGLVKDSKALSTQTGMTVVQSSELTAVLGRMGINGSASSTAFRTLSKSIADARDNAGTNALKVEDLNNKIAESKLQVNLLTAEMQKNGDTSGMLQSKITDLKTKIKTYQDGLGSTTNVLTQLGISTQDTAGKNKDFNTILGDVADKFKSMPDGAQKSADAVALFGRNGTSMIKFLDNGSQGIADLEQKAKDLGITLTNQNITTIANYTKSQKDLADSTNSLKIKVGELTAPVLTKFNIGLNNVLSSLIGVHSPFRDVTVDVLAFGGPVLGATTAVAGFLGNVASAAPILSRFANLLKLTDAFEAIQAGFSTISTVTLPAFAAAAQSAGGIFAMAFPVAGILADIALVYEAIKSVLGAMSAVNAAQKSQDNYSSTNDATIANLKNLIKNGTPTQQAASKRALATVTASANAAVSGHARGTNGAPAGWSWTGEDGPELIRMQGGEQVKDAKTSARMAAASGGNQNYFTGNIVLGDSSAVTSFFQQINQDSLLASKGLTIRQGS